MLNLFKKNIFIWCILLTINLSVIGYYFCNKEVFHIDEAWSYAHANSTQGAFLHPSLDDHMILNEDDDFLYNKWINPKVFSDYFTVQQNERFSYKHINENLSKDVHPPLYFYILHTISSFFVDDMNKWIAGSINILCFLIILFLTYIISRILGLSSIESFIPVVFWGFSISGIVSVVFLRMYALQTVFLLSLIIQVLKMLSDDKLKFRRLFFISLFTFLGCYTQYNSIVFSLILFILLGFLFIFYKQYRDKSLSLIAIMLGICSLFIVFPHAYNSLFYSARGEGIFSLFISHDLFILIDYIFDRFSNIYWGGIWNLPNFLHIYASLIITLYMWYFSFINLPINYKKSKNMAILFAITLIIVLCLSSLGFFIVLLFSLTSILLYYYKNNDYYWNTNNVSIFLFCLTIGIVLYISIFLPYWGDYDIRYFIPVTPIITVLTISFILKQSHKNKTVTFLLCILIAINIYGTNFHKKSIYGTRFTNETSSYLENIKGKKIFILDDNFSFIFFERLYYLLNAEKVWFSRDFCNEDFATMLDNNNGAHVWKLNNEKNSFYKNDFCPIIKQKLQPLYSIILSERSYIVYAITSGAPK